ncbi:MAG: ABC transporter permease [Saprospiraceae bacterium]|nr:ABC transporter permease [Saprospiraceae bacterium]
MLPNYLKIAFRNLTKNKTFSVVNIFGLAAGISVCFLVIMLIKDTHSYDQFHPESKSTYRILTEAERTNGGEEMYASSPYLVGKTLSEDYSQVELWTPLVNTFRCDIQKDKNLIQGNGLFTNASFFEMFGFELESGNPLTALDEPYTVILTKELAEKLFKDIEPIGESLTMPAYDQAFKVTGVLKEFPGKTHLEFDALGSISTQEALDKLPGSFSATSNFLNYYTSYNFVRLKDQSSEESALASLTDISRTRYSDLDLESRDAGYSFILQPLNDITPGPMMSNNMGRALPSQALWFFSILCIIIILSACTLPN